MARFFVKVTRRQVKCVGGFHVDAADEAAAREVAQGMLDADDLPAEYWSGEVEQDTGDDTVDEVTPA